MNKKPWYQSRTLWLNLLGAVAFFVQAQFGYVVDPSIQGMIMLALNAILRFDTDSALTASSNNS